MPTETGNRTCLYHSFLLRPREPFSNFLEKEADYLNNLG